MINKKENIHYDFQGFHNSIYIYVRIHKHLLENKYKWSGSVKDT